MNFASTHSKPRHWRLVMAVVALGMLAWGVAVSAYFGATGAKADAAPQYRDVESVFLMQKDGEWYTVKIDFFMFDKGDGTFAADAATAQAEMIARFPGAIEIPEGGVEAQYVTTGFKWMSGSASWGYNGSGATAGVAATALAAIQAGAQTWGQQGAQFAFTGGAPSSANTGACGGGTDGVNTVGWGNQSGSVLAVTCSWFSNTGNPWKPAAEFDMQIDPEVGSPGTELEFAL